MDGLMMDVPLMLRRLLWRAEHVFGDKELVTRVDGGFHRLTWAQYARRTRQLAEALSSLGLRPGDRVGTLAWNTYRHMECYFGVPCLGGVLHTANLRLFPEQIAYTIDHAGDRFLIIDEDQLPVVEEIRGRIPRVEAFIVMCDGPLPESSLAPLYSYEELLDGQPGTIEFPDFDERAASGICYTSATTGSPKGVVYSHRSMVLHSLALSVHGSIGAREDQSLMMISPMFHANSWGMPHAAAMQGAKLVLPGAHPTPEHYLETIEQERVTHAVGAVTIGVMMRSLLEKGQRDYDLSSLEVLWLGGQAPPRGLMEWWEREHGVYVPQGWGMTESSPLATFTYVKSKFRDSSEDERYDVRESQGLPLPLVEIKVVDEEGGELPWDRRSVGEYHMRSPWLASEYLDDPRTAEAFAEGWFKTGDVGVIDPDGYVRLADRKKDMIKSGGEWISSVDLENALMGHPDVVEACVVAVPDEQWLERPLACVVTRGGKALSDEALRAHLAAQMPKWWLPDRFELLDEIPKTGVGKFDKKTLRARFSEQKADLASPAATVGDGSSST